MGPRDRVFGDFKCTKIGYDFATKHESTVNHSNTLYMVEIRSTKFQKHRYIHSYMEASRELNKRKGTEGPGFLPFDLLAFVWWDSPCFQWILTINHILLMATRNPVNSPVEVGSEYPIIYDGFLYMPGGARFLPSTVSTMKVAEGYDA